jgi:ParB-like chromosome segregation protein Spo0J
MNAILPTPTTGANTALLRQIRDAHAADQAADLDALAALNPEVRKDSLKRSLTRLVDDGAVALEDAGVYQLTAFGAQALLALDIAEGLVDAGLGFAGRADPTEQPRWPIDQLYPNPDNPERPIDDERDANFRESIVAAGDILQALVVSPANASGARMIWAGHRRWEQCRILAEDGRLPERLAHGLPYVELAIDPAIPLADHRAIALRVALIENEQRAGIPPLEDARLLALYADLTGENGKPSPARQVALALGRAHAGSDRGVRDVQEKIKVVREASPDAIAAHEAGQTTWEQLRDSVREKKAGLTAKQLLCLTEICDYAVAKGAMPAGTVTLPIRDPAALGGDYGLCQLGLIGISYRLDHTEILIHQGAWDAVTAAGHLHDQATETNEARNARLLALRQTVVSPSRAQLAEHQGRHITEWLNDVAGGPARSTALGLGVIDPDNEMKVDGRHFPNMTLRNEYLRRVNGEGGAGSPKTTPKAEPSPEDDKPPIRPASTEAVYPARRYEAAAEIRLIELAHATDKAIATGSVRIGTPQGEGVPVGAYWLDGWIALLKSDGMIACGGGTTVPWACLTEKGGAYLAGIGIGRPIADDYLSALQDLRGLSIGEPDVTTYNTDWLQNLVPESRPLEAEPEDPSPAHADNHSSPLGGGGPSLEAMVEGVPTAPSEPTQDPIIGGLRTAAADLWHAAVEARRLLDNLIEGVGVGDDEMGAASAALQDAALSLAPYLSAEQKDARSA